MKVQMVIGAVVTGAALTFGVAVLAMAAPPPTTPAGAQWKTFGTGQWAPNSGNPGHGLLTSSALCESCLYGVSSGGAAMKSAPSDPASLTAISFDFKADTTGAGGGSPRLVLVFSDGGVAELRPLTWTENTWATVQGMSGNNWDARGGTSCGYLYATTWASIAACHSEDTITEIFVVNDSGWLYESGETVIVDNITINSSVASGPGNSQ